MADENRPLISRDPELEKAKAWWQAHGWPIVAGIAIGLTAVVGFNYWQSYEQTRAENASILFERLRGVIEAKAEVEAEAETESEAETETETETESETETETGTETETEAETDSEPEADSGARIQRIAEELMADYSATPYAVHGAFALAKFSVDGGDLDQAARVLRWILDNGDDDGLIHIARLRLAAVLLSTGEVDSAVTLLDVVDPAEFAARYYELTGDARLQKGDRAGARSAYQRSMTALPENVPGRALLKLKLDDLGE